jgi:phage regulator Rha-like protein
MVVIMSKVKFDAIQRQLAEAAFQRESHKRQREHCKEQLADLEQMLTDARDRSATAIEKKLLDIFESQAENG